MAPRVLPNPPVKHERVALIGVQTPLDSKPEPDPKPKRPSHFDDQVNPRWLRISAATQYSGINRSRLFRLIAEGKIRTACLKEHPRAKRGVRLVDRFSLDLFLETLAKPLEERLVQQANELLVQEQELAEQQKALAQKQCVLQQQLAEIRNRQSTDAT
jgi:hypothetical protein